MNAKEAVEILSSGKVGVQKWNAWRTNYPDALPDLHGVNLHKADLREVNLQKVTLNHANLSEANLQKADLSKALFIAANLSGANLSQADISQSNLAGVNLTAANLHLTNLSFSYLVNSDLRKSYLLFTIFNNSTLAKANITAAISDHTYWTNVDLSEVIGLESLDHRGPSTVGIDTIYFSKGRISQSFLSGCGVPQDLIDYLPSLIQSMNPIQFYSCFISHSSADKEFCIRLHSRMQQEKLRVWFDKEDMKAGSKLHDQVTDAIQTYDKLLLVLSPESMNSEWVKTEIYHARRKEIDLERQTGKKHPVLFPIRLCDFNTIKQWQCFDADTGKDLAREIREYYIPGDFQNWKDHDAFETAFAKLLKDLRASEPPK